jgi:hypothetical protein
MDLLALQTKARLVEHLAALLEVRLWSDRVDEYGR